MTRPDSSSGKQRHELPGPDCSPLPSENEAKHSDHTRATDVSLPWLMAKPLRRTRPSQAALVGQVSYSVEGAEPLASTHLLQAAPAGLLDELLWVYLLPNIIAHVDRCLLEKLERRRQERVRA